MDRLLDRQFFLVSQSAKGAHNKVNGTPQSLGKELAVVNRQCYRVLWIKIVHVQ